MHGWQLLHRRANAGAGTRQRCHPCCSPLKVGCRLGLSSTSPDFRVANDDGDAEVPRGWAKSAPRDRGDDQEAEARKLQVFPLALPGASLLPQAAQREAHSGLVG